MTAAVLAPIAAGVPQRYAALAAALALLVGAVCFLAGIVRLGFLADMLSRPMQVGYTTGIAALMIASQLGKITGIDVSGQDFDDHVRSFASNIKQWHWPTFVLGASVLALLLVLQRFAPRVPGPLIAVLTATAVVAVFSLDTSGIDVVGNVPSGLPPLGVPHASIHQLTEMMLPAAGIALVAFNDNIVTARVFAARKGYVIDANAELRALGACNAAAGLAHGFPVNSSGSRAALGDAAGSRTQVYSVVALALTLVVMVFAGGVLSMFPTAALGALVIYAALRLIDVSEFRRLARFRRSELVLALATTAAVVGIGVFYGVLAAVGLSFVDLLYRIRHPEDAVLGYVPGLPGMHDTKDYPETKQVPGLVIYRYDAPLCFANANDFRRRALEAVDAHDGLVEWFLFDAEADSDVDLTALDELDSLREELTRRGIVFAMARVKQELLDSLKAAGLVTKIGEDHIYMTLPAAVQAFKRR